MNRSIGARMIAVALAGVLVPRLGLGDTVYTYSFEGLTAGGANLAGQDNWVLKSGTACKVYTPGVNGTIEASAPTGGSAIGEVYRANNGIWSYAVGATDTFTLQWIGRTQNLRANEVGFVTSSGAVIFKVGNDGASWKFTPATGAATTSTAAPVLTGAFWSTAYTFVLVVDMAANGGNGSASFSVKLNSGTLTPVTGMQNMNLSLLTAGRTTADMAGLYLRGKDQARFDDIVITVAPPAAPPATKISISSGDGQSAAAGSTLVNPLKALVQAADDSPVPNVAVTFAVASGGGAFASATPVYSDASGIATSTAWTLGPAAGANTATATSAGLTGSPLTFTATATPPPTQVSIYGGDNQTAEAGFAVANPLQALVRDADNNPVAGVAITFAVASGGGSFESATPVLSDASGIATSTAWTLGEVDGLQTATATRDGLTGSPLTFTATATVPPMFTYNFNALTGGDAALNGQDGWVDFPVTGMKARGTTGENIHACTLGTGTGAGTATAYRNCGGAAAWPIDNSVKAFTITWYSIAGSSRISQLGLGNASGAPFIVVGGSYGIWRFTSAASHDTTGGFIDGGYQYFDCRLEVDLVAETASLLVDHNSSGTWSEVAGMQDMDLELPPGFVPSDMKSLFLRSRDQGGIDDIVIDDVPASPVATLVIVR